MLLQRKALHKLCHSLWRASVSGSNGHRDLSSGSRPWQIQHWLSSPPQHFVSPSSHAPITPFSPAYCHANESSLSASSHKYLKKTSILNISHHKGLKEVTTWEIPDDKILKETDDLLHVCPVFTCLSLHLHDVNPHTSVEGQLSLSAWPGKEHLEYICPSEKLSTIPQLVILEELPRSLPYNLPQTPNVSLIIDPAVNSIEISEPTRTDTNASKEARQILKIRRKKMKRHLLKKLRKRMAFSLRKMKREKRKKKEAVFQARLAEIKDWGDSFSARDWVQEELDKARKGGFYINVLEKRQ